MGIHRPGRERGGTRNPAVNTYRTEFFCQCPVNQTRVKYSLTIRTRNMVPVEEILAVVESHAEGYHEDIADELLNRFGGEQTLIADHHGVTIETERRAIDRATRDALQP